MHSHQQSAVKRLTIRTTSGFCVAAAFVLTPLALQGCDKDTSVSKKTTVKTSETPEGTKTTKETTEKKVETEHKNL